MVGEPRQVIVGIGGHHVVLVHGTWAHGFWHSRLWPLLSPKRRQRDVTWPLDARLAAAGMTVHRNFAWSGRNGHRDRMKAGEELATFIKSVTGPMDRVSIVAHSHGGLVALYSLRHPGADRVQTVVCLATPFLHFSRQPLDLRIFRGLPVAIGIIGWLFGLFAPFVLWALFIPSSLLSDTALFSIALVFAVVAAIVGWIVGRRTASALESVENRVDEMCQSYQPVARKEKHVLILRMVGDEASTALATGAFVEWLTALTWKAMVGLYALPDRLVASFLNMSRPIAGALVLTAVALLAFNARTPTVAAYAFVIVAALVVAACLVQLILLTVIVALSIIRFGLAGDVGATSFVRVNAEATPTGSWPVELLTATPGQGAEGGEDGLAHSEIHEDPGVANRIIEWVRAGEAVAEEEARV